jgi:hypothetical protein
MTECELITKTLTEAYDFVMKQEDSEEKRELIINLFKSKLLIKNCTISAVSSRRELLLAFLISSHSSFVHINSLADCGLSLLISK